jgi:hypothetical protein
MESLFDEIPDLRITCEEVAVIPNSDSNTRTARLRLVTRIALHFVLGNHRDPGLFWVVMS